MAAKVLSVSDLLKNLKKVSFSELKRQQSGFVSWVNIKDNGRLKRIYVKTPKMFAPFGATNYNPNNVPAMNNKFAVALSFKGEEENSEIAELKTLLEKLDELVIDQTCNEKTWSKLINKKKVSREVIDSAYTHLLKQKDDDENKFPALFNLKAQVNWKDGEPYVGTKVYNTNKEVLEINFENYGEVLPKLTDMKCVFQVASVWFINKKFGLTLKLVQAKVFPSNMGQLPDFALDDDEAEEEVSKVVKKTEELCLVDDEEESEDEESESDEE
ncbi:uncharacterized protein METZ01_LOCUS91736 [marine metagenome]|uniref:Uncharacterized protein n=1 Tax=marine metagenome TaxID=408172 RepID=A0A381VF06_9ZZZZ